jgi:flagellin FlaB
MNQKFMKALSKLHKGQRGISGLETAIILIAFVTVASVLAYSVLSAGIFSAERGKETVYKGLEQAQSTMELAGSVLGLSPNQTELEQVQFNVQLTIPNEKLDTTAVVCNYWDKEEHAEGVTMTMTLATGSTERGAAAFLEQDEQFTVTITIPAAANLTAYDEFNLQLIPPTGAALTIQRGIPGTIEKVMDLQ